MKKTLKLLFGKILKCLIIAIVVFAIYVLASFFHSKSLITELTDAVYRDDIEKIYELTGNNFYKHYNFDNRADENESIYEFLKNENYVYILGENGLSSFSYKLKGVKPIWRGFLYEIDITMSDYETLYLSGENIQSLLENEEFYIKEMQNNVINGEKASMEYISNEITQSVYLDDMEFEKYGTITFPVNLTYDIFTRKVDLIDAFYIVRKGGVHNANTIWKITDAHYRLFFENLNFIEFYSQSGDSYCAQFYNNKFIGIDNNQYNNKNIKDWTEINNYFIENNKLKDEIIQILSGEGYIFAEKILLVNPEQDIEIAFYDDKFVWSNNEEIAKKFLKNNFKKNEIINIMGDYGYYSGEKQQFENEGKNIELFLKDGELIWLTGDESERLTQYIVRNNLKQDEIITFLSKEGYVENK